jgi:hypothetical protein
VQRYLPAAIGCCELGRANHHTLRVGWGVQAKYVPLGWAPNLEPSLHVPSLPEEARDVDVLFFGQY